VLQLDSEDKRLLMNS